MDMKTEIKEEVPLSEVISQMERKGFSQDTTIKLNNNATICNKVCQIIIKEENVDSDFGPQNDDRQHFCNEENFLVKVKQSQNDHEMEINEACVNSDFCSQNERHFVSEVPTVTVNPCNKDSELNTKIEIKEELCWPERTCTEARCADDVTKDWVDMSSPSTESIRLYRGKISSVKSGLFTDENYGNNARFNMTKNSPECETTRKYTNKEIDVDESSSVQKSVDSEQHDGGQMVSKTSCLKPNSFIQQNSLQVQDFNKKNNCYESVLVRGNMSGNYMCEICDKRFTSSSDLKIHTLIHENSTLHQCDICGKCFPQMQLLKSHKFTHKNMKPYKCDICDKCFSGLTALKNHKLAHEGIKPHKCDTCGKCYTQFQNLKMHKLTHEGIKPHKCDTCGRCFTGMTHLKSHKLSHEGIKRHKCDICGKCFSRSTLLKSHKLAHEGIKPYKCDTCGKCFTRVTLLKSHKLAHEGLKPYKCDTCGKCYTELHSLKRHKLTHTGIKPHKCDTCGKCFTRLQNLKSHKLAHEGIKPHKCDACGKCFIRLQNLKSHKLSHEGLNSHKCNN